ncbi:MAG: 3-hydroxy-2-methylbutyryl-CoA dehydrogenase [Microvirga sp.]|nr:3-hydroxy-2-methylbutyryl-CoA dehydrogenase [Microvirga sp.]
MKLDKLMAAVVTGGASGLGEATARMLAANGAKVAILDMNAERGGEVARDIGAVFCQADVTDEASIDSALAEARAANGIERVLVNCAGIAPGKRTVSKKRETGELIPHDLASFRRAVEINLIGTYAMISKCAAAMAGLDPVTPDGGRGVIVNTSSVAAQDGQIGQAAYAASKGGVLGRLGRPEEYANLVKAIIENDMLNGEGIRLDGALRMQPK